MTDFWREARDARSADPNRDGFAIAGEPTDEGGFLYVPGEFLVTAEAYRNLPQLGTAPYTDRTDSFPEIGSLHLRLMAYSGPDPLPEHVEQLELAARSSSAQPNACAVALHHVLGGEIFIYKGGPFDAPTPAPEPWAQAIVWGNGLALAGVVDTGIPVETPLGLMDNVAADPDLDRDTMFPPGVAGGADVPVGAEAGHGAFVTGVLARASGGGVALASVKGLDADGYGTEWMVVKALQRLRQANPSLEVVNLSLGTYTHRDRMPLALGRELARLTAGTVVVAAAGNRAVPDRPYWPAADRADVGVASISGSNGVFRASPFSNSGEWVDVCTVGEDVTGPYGWGLFEEVQGHPTPIQGWASWSGTSFAAPLVAGVIASRAAAWGTSGRDAWDLLRASLPEASTVDPQLSRFGRLLEPFAVAGFDPTKP